MSGESLWDEDSVRDRLIEIVAEVKRLSPQSISLESLLEEDLGYESIDILDIMFRIEKAFGIKFSSDLRTHLSESPSFCAGKISKVEDLAYIIVSALGSRMMPGIWSV